MEFQYVLRDVMSDQQTRGEVVIEVLNARKGFDHWWHDIDPDIKEGIIRELDERIEKYNE